MRKQLVILFSFATLLLVRCKAEPACPQTTESKQYLTSADLEAQSAPLPSLSPTEVEINGQTMKVDKLVEGALCNDIWRGTVYVGCDVQVLEWEEDPLFLKDCNLNIEAGTVVYVATHNDAAYYNGCSCHTGEQP